MKKYLMMALVALTIASCSKSDDGFGIEKTYADDDFTMNERNIKEKLIGSWTIDELHACYYDKGWVTETPSTLGNYANLKIKADGSGELMGLENPKWTINGRVIEVSCVYIVGTSKDERTGTDFPISSYSAYGWSRNEAEKLVKDMLGNDATIIYEQRPFVSIRVKSMSKDKFELNEIKLPYGYRKFESYGTITRK